MFAAAGTGFALLALRPDPTPIGAEVLVAARDLPAGTTLRPPDLRKARLPEAAIPSGAIRTPATGRILAGPMRQGEPLTDVRLVSSALLRAYGPSTVATPVRIADSGTVRLLRQGDHVDVLSADTPPTGNPHTGRARLLIASAPVIAIPPHHPNDQGALIVLATNRPQATTLTAARPPLAITITHP
ncbi:SAF domain-containing protein [Actinomadura sp. NBRC 104412]|uniref:SAF domain-containing protein n=1 Tax=Actinomadura sp. NBRC 104412 TaxID=3032203 RepID=UPI003326A3C3